MPTGRALASERQELKLLRHRFTWQGNDAGITDKVIPPWTPVQASGERFAVWNRVLNVDGLGCARSIANGGVGQIQAMRLVAVVDGRETVLRAGAPKVEKRTEAAAEFSGQGSGAGLNAHSPQPPGIRRLPGDRSDHRARERRGRGQARRTVLGSRAAGVRGHALLHHGRRLDRRPRRDAAAVDQPADRLGHAGRRLRAVHLADQLGPAPCCGSPTTTAAGSPSPTAACRRRRSCGPTAA